MCEGDTGVLTEVKGSLAVTSGQALELCTWSECADPLRHVGSSDGSEKVGILQRRKAAVPWSSSRRLWSQALLKVPEGSGWVYVPFPQPATLISVSFCF